MNNVLLKLISMDKLTKSLFFKIIISDDEAIDLKSLNAAYEKFISIIFNMSNEVIIDGTPVFFILSYTRIELIQLQRRFNKKNIEVALFLEKAILNIDVALKWIRLNNFKPVVSKGTVQKTAKLEWTANIVDLVELTIALLEAKAFNRGRISKATVINTLCQFFNIEISSFYATYNNIKSRENRTQFLDELKNLLELKIDNDDERISNRNKKSKTN